MVGILYRGEAVLLGKLRKRLPEMAFLPSADSESPAWTPESPWEHDSNVDVQF